MPGPYIAFIGGRGQTSCRRQLRAALQLSCLDTIGMYVQEPINATKVRGVYGLLVCIIKYM